MNRSTLLAATALLLAPAAAMAQETAQTYPFAIEVKGQLDEPWAMTFLPDGRMLVTEKPGQLHIVTQDGEASEPVEGVPEVAYCGQGGLGDVALHPDYAENDLVYLTFAEAGENDTRGAAMGRGTLDLDAMRIDDFEVLWRQDPKVTGCGHYSHKIAFSPDGQYLFLSSGERQKKDPAQDRSSNLGAVLRLTPEGEAAEGNPFYDEGGVTAQIWSYGHRNTLGLAFDEEGTLWQHEMGPKGGDEFQKIEKGENYGWPVVSNGDNYDGSDIPEHDTRPEFRQPDEFWNPVISPSSMIIYDGAMFDAWQGSPLITGLNSRALVQVSLNCEWDNREICEAERYGFENRLREIEQGPDGAVWLLEDERDGEGGRLLKLTPAE